MQVLKYVHLRTCSRPAPHSVGNALEEIATPLRRRQFQWLRYIRINSAQAWSDLGQFGRVVSHPPAVIIQARRLGEAAFDDLREWEKGNPLVSFVTVSDQVSEAGARRVLRHLHRQAALAHARSAREHDDRAVTG